MGCSVSTKVPNLQHNNTIRNLEELKFQPSTFVQENLNSFQEIYRMGNILGSGSYGDVRVCYHRANGSKRAVKIFRKDQMTNEVNRANLEKEISILRSLDHPHIIRIYEFFEDIKKLYIVMEYCKGGELFNQIIQKKTFSEQKAVLIMKQLFSCVAYLHSHNITHRDLKPENILLEENNEVYNIKLIDFGGASFNRFKKLRGRIGTAYYIAPEVLQSSYTEKCDLWSCGVILHILLVGYPPFDGNEDEEILEKVRLGKYSLKGELWSQISSQAKNLIERLLCSASHRLSAIESLNHPWIALSNNTHASPDLITPVLDRLRVFNNTSKMKDAVQTFIISQCISVNDTKTLREVFRSIDKNGDGILSRDELLDAYRTDRPEPEAVEEVERIMKEVDTDLNGYIDYSEFIKATLDRQKLLSYENLKMAFQMFDRDGNGSISASELKRVLQGTSIIDDEIWERIIKEIDQNGDGEIDLSEFQDLLLSSA